METKKALAALVAAGFFGFAALIPAYGQEEPSIPEMEQEQMDDSAQPDVDADTYEGADEPIPEEELEEVEN